MTYNEIIKSLGICANDGDCKECKINPHKGNYGYCTSLAIKAALDLINRQKEKIEVYEKENREKFNKWLILEKRTKERYAELYEEAKDVVRAEAIKDFAERLKEMKYQSSEWSHGAHPFVVEEEDIDYLVEEMTGGGEEDGRS
jgi:hypothetical protein